MNDIYITQFNVKKYPNRLIKTPRPRYLNYYHDLHWLFRKTICADSLIQGSQYSYVELGTPVLNEIAQVKQLKNVDLMVIATWAHEFDPDHASCGAYFAEHYGMKGMIFDVSDQGVTATVTALQLINSYLQYDKYQNALLLVMEQTSIPTEMQLNAADLPQMTAAIAIYFEKHHHFSKNKLRLISAGSQTESMACHIGQSNIIKIKPNSAIEPLLSLMNSVNSTEKNRVFKMIIDDFESNRESYVVWENC